MLKYGAATLCLRAWRASAKRAWRSFAQRRAASRRSFATLLAAAASRRRRVAAVRVRPIGHHAPLCLAITLKIASITSLEY